VPGTPAAAAPSALPAALLMSPAPKPEPGTATGEIPTSAAGVPRYQLPLAFTYLPGPSGAEDLPDHLGDRRHPQGPAQDIPSGSPVMSDGPRCGLTQPEARESGKGIRGGRTWLTTNGMRPAAGRFRGNDAA